MWLCPEVVSEKASLLDCISVLPFVHTLRLASVPGKTALTGSRLSFGTGIFVIISKITDHGLLRVTVEAKNLLSSYKSFFSLSQTTCQGKYI